jgi:hypothetical protein
VLPTGSQPSAHEEERVSDWEARMSYRGGLSRPSACWWSAGRCARALQRMSKSKMDGEDGSKLEDVGKVSDQRVGAPGMEACTSWWIQPDLLMSEADWGRPGHLNATAALRAGAGVLHMSWSVCGGGGM